ncbi:amino acid permease [Rubrivirga sp.]|uniref:amino acid permease n=1 Tax=Rubrivirga sp. TaxID=1885344 RepID=UPI003C75A431
MPQHPAADLGAVPPETTGHVPGPRKFGTFAGVFTPTLLTILGVIMYLRTGWVVGNAGVLGALGVIGLSFGITIATGLSMSSITTNIRIGAGGAYSIISQSLGLEVGGSVGIPLYLSQALAVALYVFGFREGWAWVFPEHPAILVDLGVFAVVLGIAYVSASFAFRVQYLIMVVIAASLVSVAVAAAEGSMVHDLADVGLVGPYVGAPEDGFSGTSFWAVFAVFFPAATGIMAGANMSGDLRDPKRSIPIGTLSAIAVSLVVYLALAYWLARSATPEELVSNYTVMIDRAAWGPAVVAGLLGATFSSALASIVGAPRILQALGDHGVLPRGEWLAKRTPKGEPRHALLVTAAIVAGALLLRDLNAIAPVITMFFLITYAMINFVVFVEGQLGLVSFRPRLRVPQLVPLAGLVGCLLAMFVVNPAFGLAAVVVVVAFYGFLLRSRLDAPYGDVRSGLFVALAEWAAKRVRDMPDRQERAWKPNLLVPVEDVAVLRGTFEVVLDVARPRGSVKLVGLNETGLADGGRVDGSRAEGRLDRLPTLAAAFRRKGVFSSFAVLDAPRFEDGVVAAIQALRGSFFRPNVLFLPLPPPSQRDGRREAAFARAVAEARHHQLGTLVWAPHPTAGLGQRYTVNVWVHDRSPDWRISMDIGNLDLSLLIAYKLQQNWDGRIRLHTVVEDEAKREQAHHFLTRLIDLARLPHTEPIAVVGDFHDVVRRAAPADLNLFGLMPEPTFAAMHDLVETTRASALFVRDSGLENALA